MNSFFQAILVIAAVLGIYGCDASSYTDEDTSTQADGTQQGDANAWGEVNIGVGESKVILEAKSPDGKPVDFYVCSGGCVSSDPASLLQHAEFKAPNAINFVYYAKAITNKDRDIVVYALRKDHLFVPKFESLRGSAQTINKYSVSWETQGDWGLAPNGTYKSSHNGKNESVSTTVEDGKVTLAWANSSAIITGDEISPYSTDSTVQVSGKILFDLSEIQIKREVPSTPEKNFISTLTIVQ